MESKIYNYPVTVEFEDVDSYGIVNHTKILSYFERARVHFLSDNGIDVKTSKIGLVIVNLNVKFKKSLILLDKINIELSVKELGSLKFIWGYKIRNKDKVSVIAEIEQVVIDLNNNKMIYIPDDLKKILETIQIRN
jgi:acyl-CoA thioester hydrolase